MRQQVATISQVGISEPVYAFETPGFTEPRPGQPDCCLLVNSADWSGGQTVYLQIGNRDKFADLKYGSGDKIAFDEDTSIFLFGGLWYRLRTTIYTSPITFTFIRLPIGRQAP